MASILRRSLSLTPRERHILQLASEGHDNREIAARLHLSHDTITSYFVRIYAHLGIRQAREEAIMRFLQDGAK